MARKIRLLEFSYSGRATEKAGTVFIGSNRVGAIYSNSGYWFNSVRENETTAEQRKLAEVLYERYRTKGSITDIVVFFDQNNEIVDWYYSYLKKKLSKEEIANLKDNELYGVF